MRIATRITLLLLLLAASADARLSEAAIQAAARYSADRFGRALLIIENGATRCESNQDGGSARDARKIFSGTKAFWNLAALAAAEDGLLSLDEPAADTLPEWRTDPRKARITVRQLLDFSAGLDPGFFLHEEKSRDRDRTALALPLAAEPGSAFIYGPAALQVFHQLLKRKLAPRRETPTHYLERRILRPLRLGPQRYLADGAGNPLLATGWFLTPRQWSRLGRLVLAGGAPIISGGSLSPSWRGSPPNRAFSLGWWNNRAAPGGREFDFEEALDAKWFRQSWSAACICREAPRDLVACIGSGYQRLYVIPSLGLIIVRQGGGGRFSDAHFLRLLLRGA